MQYRNLLRFSNRFSAYNFREYAKRRTHDAFHEHRHESDPAAVAALLARGQKDLQMLKVRRGRGSGAHGLTGSSAKRC